MHRFASKAKDATERLAPYRTIRSVSVRYGATIPSEVQCEVVLSPAIDDNARGVRLLFRGSRNLLFRQPDLGTASVQLVIKDISDRQLEDLNYEVFDEEQEDCIGLLARDFECFDL